MNTVADVYGQIPPQTAAEFSVNTVIVITTQIVKAVAEPYTLMMPAIWMMMTNTPIVVIAMKYAIEILAEYAGYFGIAEEDVYALVYYGYDELEIEEMLYDPVQMQRCISELRLMEMC